MQDPTLGMQPPPEISTPAEEWEGNKSLGLDESHNLDDVSSLGESTYQSRSLQVTKNSQKTKDIKALKEEAIRAGISPAAVEVATDILHYVDQAQIFKEKKPRRFPTFRNFELSIGSVLGVGGFSCVSEIQRVSNGMEEETSPGSTRKEHSTEVDKERKFIVEQCLRKGQARYAIKRLREDLAQDVQETGVIDLAVEAKFLTVLSHPNIVKMRATAEGNPIRKDYFIVLDRLYGTLVQKMEEWKASKRKKTLCLTFGRRNELNKLLVDRLVTAYDLSAAFRYMHEQNILYRDIKPENIGFDVRGDVKVFDFGFCRDLDPKLLYGGGLYHLTGRAGTTRYMAPEVHLRLPYGKTADVYSFGILFWEIMALKVPFDGMTIQAHQVRVILGDMRPFMPKSWPPYTHNLIRSCWSASPHDRPNFEKVASMIRSDLNLLTQDQHVLDRSNHMLDRSLQSFKSVGDSGSTRSES